MPRLKDLKDQQLYMLDREHVAGDLRGLFRSAIDVEFVREQWDQLVRVASSLRDRTAPAHVVLDRLAASSRSDRLARALTMLGRVVKTTFILRYIHDAAVRDRIHLQLNRAESRHALARRLFFANQGSFSAYCSGTRGSSSAWSARSRRPTASPWIETTSRASRPCFTPT